jgi:hypothetical protein
MLSVVSQTASGRTRHVNLCMGQSTRQMLDPFGNLFGLRQPQA